MFCLFGPVGPGQGVLTIPLLERVGSLHAIELDRDLVIHLKERCRGKGDLTIHNEDALRFDFKALRADGGLLRLVGNLPYNISTPLMFHVLGQADSIRDMHFMLQKEVVARMAASPGGKDYGRLTVMLAALCRVEPLFDIGPGAFRPPPRVRSAFVRLSPWRKAPFPFPDQMALAKVVATAFSKNALSGLMTEEQILSAECDPTVRPERLDPSAFGRLACRLNEGSVN